MNINREEERITAAKYRQGWRVQVTTLPREGYSHPFQHGQTLL
jgi:hypothetical protein